jgi:hypothetical protein
MERDYDVFEIMPDGSLIWRGAVSGHEKAILKLKELASGTSNVVRLMHIPTKTFIAEMNISKAVRPDSDSPV